MAQPSTSNSTAQLFEAVCNGDADTVKTLLTTSPPPALDVKQSRDPKGYNVNSATALHIACERNYSEIVRLLVEGGASPEALDGKRRTPLHLAAGSGSPEIVRYLVSRVKHKKEYINLRDEDENTPLLVACAKPQRTDVDGNMDVVLHLLEEGADMMAINNAGETAAHRAVRDSGDLEILRLLGEKAPKLLGLQTRLHQRDNNTCLHLATVLRRVEHVEWLLDTMNHEDVRKKDSNGLTAWDIASDGRWEGSFEVTSAFAAKETQSMDPFYQWHRVAKLFNIRMYALWIHNVSNAPSEAFLHSSLNWVMVVLTSWVGAYAVSSIACKLSLSECVTIYTNSTFEGSIENSLP
jgi:ankyrin repeat protein